MSDWWGEGIATGGTKKEFYISLEQYKQAAIQSFAKELTEGEQIACAICCFSSMESAANPEIYSCVLTDRPCPIRKAANLTGDSNDR